MDKKLSVLVGLFLSGVIAGILLVMRWMQLDHGLPQTESPVPDAGPTTGESPAKTDDQHGLHHLAESIKTGAKADIVRVRRACTRVVHRSTHDAEQGIEEAVPADIS